MGSKLANALATIVQSAVLLYWLITQWVDLFPWNEVASASCAQLARNLGNLMKRRGMRRVKLAVRTFWSAFEEMDLGQRIHQFVRVVSEGFSKSFGRDDFISRCRAFMEKGHIVECRQLYSSLRAFTDSFLPVPAIRPLPFLPGS